MPEASTPRTDPLATRAGRHTSRVVVAVTTLTRLIIALAIVAIIIVMFWLAPHLRDRLDATSRTAAARMTVTGNATERVSASAATVTVVLQSKGKSNATSLTAYNRALRRAQLTLKRAGLAKSDLTATGPNTYGRATTWQSNGELAARITDIKDVANILQAISTLKTGVVGTQGPFYEYDNDAQAAHVLDKAVASARAKATSAAKRTDMRVVGIAQLTEIARPTQYGAPYAAAAGGGGLITRTSLASFRATGGGTRPTSAQVKITFRLEPR